MKRKLAGGLAVLLVAVVVIWWIEHRGEPAKTQAPATHAQRSMKLAVPRTQPAASASQREWARDVDPEGPLRLEGQVVDADGSGVGGATVWLSSVPPRSATTEGDGTFAFDKVVGREYSLTATAGERIGGPVTYRLTASSDPVVIRISAGAKVIVEVTGDGGQPIANATVKLQDFAETTKPTGADGTVTLAPVHPGWVGVEVTAAGYGVANGFGQVGSAGATATIRVKLHEGVAVSGRVIDGPASRSRRHTSPSARRGGCPPVAAKRRAMTRASSRSRRSPRAPTCCTPRMASTRRRARCRSRSPIARSPASRSR
jgi:hypothetical protein